MIYFSNLYYMMAVFRPAKSKVTFKNAVTTCRRRFGLICKHQKNRSKRKKASKKEKRTMSMKRKSGSVSISLFVYIIYHPRYTDISRYMSSNLHVTILHSQMKQSWIPQKQSLCFVRHYAIQVKLVQRPSRNAFLKKIQIKCGINMFRLWERYHNDIYIKNYPNYIDILLSQVMITW